MKQVLQDEIYKKTYSHLIELNRNVSDLNISNTVSVNKIIDSLKNFNKYIKDERLGSQAGSLLISALSSYLSAIFPSTEIETYH